MLHFELRRGWMARSGALLEKQTMSMLGKRKVQFLATLATLYLVGAAVACTGFFQNPTVSSLTVGPSTFTLNQGSTQQMTATATYNDGTTKALTGSSGIVWSSSDTTIVSVTNSGLATGLSVGGPVTLTGEYGTVSNTASATVALTNVTAITISPRNSTVPKDGGTSQTFTAAATVTGVSGTVDVTSQCQWSISSVSGGGSAADFTINGQDTSGITFTTNSTSFSGEVATVTASYTSTTTVYTATATLTVQ